jgi:hypothetical protein
VLTSPVVAGVDDPASEDVEGVGGFNGVKLAHDDVRMVREVTEEHPGVGSQNRDFSDGQGWQKVGQATNTGGTQPRAERDAAADPCCDGTRIKDLSSDREFWLAQQASPTR